MSRNDPAIFATDATTRLYRQTGDHGARIAAVERTGGGGGGAGGEAGPEGPQGAPGVGPPSVVKPNTSFEAALINAPTAQAGMQVRIVDNVGNTVYGPSSAGVAEDPLVPGYYTVTLTSPSSSGQYSVIWDDGTPTPDTTASEDILVSLGALLWTDTVTSLPASPAQGQIIYYEASADVLWTFRYGSDSLWHFAGGPPLIVQDLSECQTASGTFADPGVGTVGPQLSLPFDGDYVIGVEAFCFVNANTVDSYIAAAGLSLGETPQSDDDAAIVADDGATSGSVDGWSVHRNVHYTGLTVAAHHPVKMVYRQAGLVTAKFTRRTLTILPIKVSA